MQRRAGCVVDMDSFKLLVCERGDEPAVASTIVDHRAAHKMAHVFAKKGVDGDIPVLNLKRVASNILRNSRICGLDGDTIPVVGLRSIVAIETQEIFKGILM